MRVRAILDPGLRGPGIVSRRIRLTGEDQGSGVWEGELHLSRGLVMKKGDSASTFIGRKEGGFLSLLRMGRWDFLLDGKPVAVANVGHGFEVGSIFYPVSIGDYGKMAVMQGDGWRLDRGVMDWPDVRIEGDSLETVLAVSGVVALYEGVLVDR